MASSDRISSYHHYYRDYKFKKAKMMQKDPRMARLVLGNFKPMDTLRLPTISDVLRHLFWNREPSEDQSRFQIGPITLAFGEIAKLITIIYQPLNVPMRHHAMLISKIKCEYYRFLNKEIIWPTATREEKNKYKKEVEQLFPVIKCDCYGNKCSCKAQIDQEIFDYIQRQKNGKILQKDIEWMEKKQVEFVLNKAINQIVSEDNKKRLELIKQQRMKELEAKKIVRPKRIIPERKKITLPVPVKVQEKEPEPEKKLKKQPIIIESDSELEIEDEADNGSDPDYKPPENELLISLDKMPTTLTILEELNLNNKTGAFLINTLIGELKDIIPKVWQPAPTTRRGTTKTATAPIFAQDMVITVKPVSRKKQNPATTQVSATSTASSSTAATLTGPPPLKRQRKSQPPQGQVQQPKRPSNRQKQQPVSSKTQVPQQTGGTVYLATSVPSQQCLYVNQQQQPYVTGGGFQIHPTYHSSDLCYDVQQPGSQQQENISFENLSTTQVPAEFIDYPYCQIVSDDNINVNYY